MKPNIYEHTVGNVKLVIRDIQAGYATRKLVVIPKWVFKEPEKYWIYYVCHELAHIIQRRLFDGFGHTKDFKTIEGMLLADFGYKIEYAKTYPKNYGAGIKKL